MRAALSTYVALALLLFCLCIPIRGMGERKVRHHIKTRSEMVAARYADSLSRLAQCYDSLRLKPSEGLPDNPYLYPLLTQPVYYHAPAHRVFFYDDSLGLRPSDTGQALQDSLYAWQGRTLMAHYMAHPEDYQLTERDLQKAGGIRDVAVRTPQPEIPRMATQKELLRPELDDEPVDIRPMKPNFWTFRGSYALQFMQNYVSDGWYQGGEPSHSFLATVNLQLNFNNKQKVTFENSLDMKLGFQYFKSDTVHHYRTTTDQLRMVNKLGLQAHKHWYYTLLLQSWTQFFPSYKANRRDAQSDFMSPFESVFSIGMEYKITTKNKRFNLSANISPFAFDFKYVDRLARATAFGLKKGKHKKFDYGSNLTMNASWTIAQNISWRARFYYYTNYRRVQAEWENTFNFTINRYLSAKVFLYPRFDDDAYRSDHRYLQFKEYLSLGLNVNF